uniref:Adenylosuccinate synthetase n=1 Tax=Angomonas desouzai TaxID=59800 RepID=U5KN34_9TRYP|nr:adenylosuccinate synthase [Angomonas desouzai]
MPVRRYGSNAPTPAPSAKEGSIISHHDPNAGVTEEAPVHTPPRVSAASRLQPRNSVSNTPGSVNRSLNQSQQQSPEQTKRPRVNVDCRSTEAQKLVYEGIKNTKPIPELQEPRRVKPYSEASVQDSLYRIVDANDIIMVAGAFFGDEGKGKTVDAVARHPKCTSIARVNSGENAGHTVYDDKGRKFVFNLAPSGLLLEGKKNYVGPECVMDPVSFMQKEVQQLVDAEIEYKSRLFIGNVHVVAPYHKLLDLLGSGKNASTLKGMSPVHASKVTKRGIRLDHIFNDEKVMRARLKRDMETYFAFLKQQGLSEGDVLQRCLEENEDGVIRVPPYVVEFVTAKDKIQFLVDLYQKHVVQNPDFPRRADVIHELRATLLRGEKILLEGPQSYWLSNAREKFWSSSTSADTSAAGLLATSQLNFQRFKSVVINVHKAPGSSRVGVGACPSSFVAQDFFSSQNINTLLDLPEDMCRDFDAIQSTFNNRAFANRTNPDKFNGIVEPVEYKDDAGTYNINVAMAIGSAIHHGECGAVTKKPRVCGFFDCVLHHEVNACQGPYLSISALDRGDEYDHIGLVIAYVFYSPDGSEVSCNGRVYKNGEIIRAGEPVPNESALFHCHPIVKLVKGWKDSPISAKTRKRNAPLPPAVCEYIGTIEHFTGCKVLSIGNGPNADDIIYLKQ